MANKWLTTTAMAVGLLALPGVANAEQQWRLFGGISSPEDIESNYYGYTAEITTESGFVVGGAWGVVHNDFVWEGELAYRTAELDELSFGPYTVPADGDISAISIMGNGWYNFPTTGNWGGYIGGGVGFAQAEFDAGGYSYDSTEFAWQLGAGINVKTDSGFAYGIGYRYFSIPEIDESDADVSSHEILFEVSSRF
jgi:opacity protein-like surface antigen